MAAIIRPRPRRPTREPPAPPQPLTFADVFGNNDPRINITPATPGAIADTAPPREYGSMVNGLEQPVNTPYINTRLEDLQRQAREAIASQAPGERSYVTYGTTHGNKGFRPAKWLVNWEPDYDVDAAGSGVETRNILANPSSNPSVFNYRIPSYNPRAAPTAVGGFFNGLLTPIAEEALLRFGIDLSIDQVWTRNTILSNLEDQPHCLWNCLTMATDDQGMKIASQCRLEDLCKENVKIKVLKKVSEVYEREVKVTFLSSGNNIRYTVYGEGKGNTMNLVLYRGHYMINRTFETHYNGKPLTIRKAIREKALGTENEATPAQKGNPKINTFQLLRLLDANGYIENIPTNIKMQLPANLVPGFKTSDAFIKDLFIPDPDNIGEVVITKQQQQLEDLFALCSDIPDINIVCPKSLPMTIEKQCQDDELANLLRIAKTKTASDGTNVYDLYEQYTSECLDSMKDDEPPSVWYGDYETTTDKNNIHIPYLGAAVSRGGSDVITVSDSGNIKNLESQYYSPALLGKKLLREICMKIYDESEGDRDPEGLGHYDPMDDPSGQSPADPEVVQIDKLKLMINKERAKMANKKKSKPKKVIIYFHNLRYDANFILGALERISSIESGSRLFQAKGYFYLHHWENGVRTGSTSFAITLRDSWAFLQCKLKDFTKMFNLEEEKDSDFNYSCMTPNTLKEDDYLPTESDKEWVEKIPPKYICKRTGRVLIYKYATDYCIQDCRVLQKGFDIFVKDCSDKLGLCVDKCITTASLAHNYMIKEGCLDGVVQLEGCVREYVQQSVVGGRVMTRNNTTNEYRDPDPQDRLDDDDSIDPKDRQDQGLVDFDAVSLYPTAMTKIPGYPIGRPTKFMGDPELSAHYIQYLRKQNDDPDDSKSLPDPDDPLDQSNRHADPRDPQDLQQDCHLTDADLELLIGSDDDDDPDDPAGQSKNQDDPFYVATVRLTKINAPLIFSTLSTISQDDHVRNWGNVSVGDVMILNKVQIESARKHEGAEFEFIGGLIWLDGYNDKIRHVINHLFEWRKKLKKEKNPLQATIKLILNSPYGKLIERPHDEKMTWFRETEDRALQKAVRVGPAFVYLEEVPGTKWVKYDVKHDKNKEIPIITSMWKLRSKGTMTSTHKNYAHAGSLVLAQSKEIMYQVTTPLDNDILYTDTDSIILPKVALNKFLRENDEKGLPSIIGSSLGNFHSDFDWKLGEGEESGGEIIADQGIFLSKKAYVCRLRNLKYPDADPQYHARFKGIPTSCLVTTAKNAGVDMMTLYRTIRDKGITVDLTLGNPVFRQGTVSIKTIGDFSRKVGPYI